MRIALLCFAVALVLGVLGLFKIIASGLIWIFFAAFLVLTTFLVAGFLAGFGGKTPMD
jgi:hypothetical protein